MLSSTLLLASASLISCTDRINVTATADNIPAYDDRPIQQTVYSAEDLAKIRKQYGLDSAWESVGPLIGVSDGDTFYLGKSWQDNTKKIRLQGVDTPETRKFANNGWVDTSGPQHYHGKRATNYVAHLFRNANNILYHAVKQDRYGRDVARVLVDGKDLSVLLVSGGYAKVAYLDRNPKSRYYTDDAAFYDEIMQAQRQAREANRGIWSKEVTIQSIYPPKSPKPRS